MARLNEFITRIDLSELNDYVANNGKDVVYAKGERIVQQGCLCRYLDTLVKTPSERFRELVIRNPMEIHNLPMQEIASYLGISRRQLHRIREAKSAAETSGSKDI